MGKKIKSFVGMVLHCFEADIAEGKNGLLQFIKFSIIGISNTIISYALNIMVLWMMEPLEVSWDYVVGNLVSFILSVLWSFYWNSKYVFVLQPDEERKTGKTLVKTYISYGLTGIVFNNILSWVWITQVGISKFVAPLINLFISVPLNFLMNKLWAFKSQK